MEEPRREDGGSGRFVISRVSTAHGEVEKAKLSSAWEGSEVAERIFGPFSALRMTLETDGDRYKCHHGGSGWMQMQEIELPPSSYVTSNRELGSQMCVDKDLKSQ